MIYAALRVVLWVWSAHNGPTIAGYYPTMEACQAQVVWLDAPKGIFWCDVELAA